MLDRIDERPFDYSNTPAVKEGLTKAVARGSLFNLTGQAVVLFVSFVATPFVIRLLGSELYGVLSIINLLIGYLAFADFGMGVASTRFAADAWSQSDTQTEASIVWTALAIVSMPVTLAAVTLMLIATPLFDRLFHLEGELRETAAFALRVACLGFVARSFAAVLNTPQLVRLRFDIYTSITTGTSVIQICLVPLVLSFGGGIDLCG